MSVKTLWTDGVDTTLGSTVGQHSTALQTASSFVCIKDKRWTLIACPNTSVDQFLPRDTMHKVSAVFAVARCPSVCLSVRLSRWCIVSRRLKIHV